MFELIVGAIAIGVYGGWWLHELSHWFLGVLFSSNPKIYYKFVIVPVRVKHLSLANVSNRTVRYYGVIPLIWWLPLLVLVGIMLQDFSLLIFALFVPLLTAVVGFSRGDLLAIEKPETYRVRSKNDELPSGNGYVELAQRMVR